MATWAKGFSGVGYSTREEFRKFLNGQVRPNYDRVVIHNTGAPYITPPGSPGQRVRDISVHYKSMGWSAGPDFFVYPTGVYLGSPLGKSVGCKGWNGNSFHVECEGKYTPASKQDPKTNPEAAAAWKTMAWVTAEILQWMSWGVNNDRIKFHKEGNTTHKKCPGDLISKPWFLSEVTNAMTGFGPPPYEPKKPATPKPATVPHPKRATVKKGSTGGEVPVLQKALKNLGYYTGAVDGDFGYKTLAAVQAFQRARGLVADGVVGPKTWDALTNAKPSKPVVAPTAPQKPQEAPKPVPAPEPKPEPKPAPVPPVAVGTKRQPIADMHISKKGLDMIKHFEGLRLEPYWDNGALAIGYGHANHSKKLPVVYEGMKITEAQAEAMLASDLIDYENRVKKTITVPLKQGEFDALVSLAYNWGPGNLDRSNLKQLINAGNYGAAAFEITTILPSKDKKYYAGIKRRRGKESDLFASD